MTQPCLDDNCYNLTKQLSKKLEFLAHSSGYVNDSNKCNSEGSERAWKTIIADEEKHVNLLRNQLAEELQKITIPS